jgi:aminoglycoside phosphotransferase (APT) family kinase protein
MSTELGNELHQIAQVLTRKQLPCDWELVASSSHTLVARNPDRGLYYKEFRPRSPAEKLKALMRGSRAERARRNGDALLRVGISAPANVAWGSLDSGREYLFTLEVPGRGIDQWLRDSPERGSSVQLARRRQLLDELGVFIGRVHASGFIHGDLRPGNVLASFEGGRFRFSLIDNERTVRFEAPPGRGLLRNLMQLNMLPPAQLSLAARARFFRAWRRQMRDLSRLESTILGAEAYRWAMRRLDEKGLLSPEEVARAGL